MRQETFSVAELPARTIRKIQDDARRLRHLARFIIVLDESGAVRETIENHPESYECFTRPVIAILAPTKIGDKTLPETLVFEMTYERAVPYARIEENLPGGGIRVPIPKRRRVRCITEQELRSAWPTLKQAFISILKERLYHWKSLGDKYWLGKGNGFYRGIFFRIPSEDAVAIKEFWNEHLRYREPSLRKALKKIVRLRYSYYSEKQLRSFKSIHSFVELCEVFRIEERRWILENAGDRKTLVALIYDTFSLTYTDKADEPGSDRKDVAEKFSRFMKMTAYFHKNRERKRHAMDCVTVELAPKRELVLALEREKWGDIHRYLEKDTDDGNIPFTTEELTAHDARVGKPSDPDGIPF
jgi:hypothetical protein